MFETIVRKVGNIVHCVFIPVVRASNSDELKDISHESITERLKTAFVTP